MEPKSKGSYVLFIYLLFLINFSTCILHLFIFLVKILSIYILRSLWFCVGVSGAELKMGDHSVTVTDNNNHQSTVIEIYPLGSYYFGSKDPIAFRDETIADRVQRMKSKYSLSVFFSFLFNIVALFFFQSIDFVLT